jgi:hypothetical protein
MFCTLGLVLGGNEGVHFYFHVLRSQKYFRRYRGRRLLFHVLRSQTRFRQHRGRQHPFSCFARSNSFSTVPTASGPVFMFCATRHVFGDAKDVGSRFQVLRSRTHFRRFRGRRVPFSCFASPYTFSAVPRALGPVLRFWAHRLVFDGTEGVGSRTRFPWYRRHRVPVSCFVRPYSFSAVPRASGPFFIFSAPGIIFGATEGVRFRFHVLRSRMCFWRCGGCRLLFSCFAFPNSFLAVPWASGPGFMFCALVLIFGCTEGVGPHCHIFRPQNRFRRYRGRPLPFSCFALLDVFLAVRRA